MRRWLRNDNSGCVLSRVAFNAGWSIKNERVGRSARSGSSVSRRAKALQCFAISVILLQNWRSSSRWSGRCAVSGLRLRAWRRGRLFGLRAGLCLKCLASCLDGVCRKELWLEVGQECVERKADGRQQGCEVGFESDVSVVQSGNPAPFNLSGLLQYKKYLGLVICSSHSQLIKTSHEQLLAATSNSTSPTNLQLLSHF